MFFRVEVSAKVRSSWMKFRASQSNFFISLNINIIRKQEMTICMQIFTLKSPKLGINIRQRFLYCVLFTQYSLDILFRIFYQCNIYLLFLNVIGHRVLWLKILFHRLVIIMLSGGVFCRLYKYTLFNLLKTNSSVLGTSYVNANINGKLSTILK